MWYITTTMTFQMFYACRLIHYLMHLRHFLSFFTASSVKLMPRKRDKIIKQDLINFPFRIITLIILLYSLLYSAVVQQLIHHYLCLHDINYESITSEIICYSSFSWQPIVSYIFIFNPF